MAITALNDAYILVDSVELSDHANQVRIEDNRDALDVTAFGSANKAVAKGLGDGKITITFFQDFAADSVHETLQGLIGSNTPVEIEVRPTSSARGATNPAVVMEALLMNYNPLDGSVGQVSTITAEFVNASQLGVQYKITADP